MTSNHLSTDPLPKQVSHLSDAATRAALRRFQIGSLALLFAFALPLWNLFRLALKTEIQSHILLIPFIIIYLWKTSPGPQPNAARPSPALSFTAGLLGLAALIGYWLLRKGGRIAPSDALSLSTTAFLFFLLAVALATLGWGTLRHRLFAVCFCVFFIPLPLIFTETMSIWLQKASAEAADLMISLTGMPVLRDGLIFKFTTLTVRVAEECSGMRSTFVLFITSLLAGHMFLRTGWKKALLALAIFPLGILRNGFRIASISWLTVNVDSRIIDGPLHHHGGPLFFVLSLLPLFALLWILQRTDRRSGTRPSAQIVSPESR